MQQKDKPEDNVYSRALDSIVKYYNQSWPYPDFFASKLIFKDEYAEECQKHYQKTRSNSGLF